MVATGGPQRTAATYGQVVVHEAQDLPPLALRTIARRCPSGSLTVLGDLAQSTGPAGAERCDAVLDHLDAPDGTIEVLNVSYRGPLIGAITASLADHGLVAVAHLHGSGPDDIPIFPAEAAKGLEFDVVVVVEPGVIQDGSRRARLVCVALTCAVQTVILIVAAPLPVSFGLEVSEILVET